MLLCLPGSWSVAQAAELRSFAVAIKQRKIDPASRLIRVTQGDTVEIAFTSDQAAELHLHGYDLSVTLAPATAATLRFEAKFGGRFALEAHRFGPPGQKQQREVTLLYLEVLPR
jgi:hypothetical protein